VEVALDTTERAPEVVDNGNTPIFNADALQDVTVIGGYCFFLLYDLKLTPGGVAYKEPFFVKMRNEAVGPGIALTVQRAGSVIAIPIIKGLTQAMEWLN
jgi:hypothetical protein